VQAEKNTARVIAAKELVFNIGLSPVELLIELILRAARTQRCAGEGELVFGLTEHGGILSISECGVNRPFLPVLSPPGPGTRAGFSGIHALRGGQTRPACIQHL
jgi:hypothetical protein